MIFRIVWESLARRRRRKLLSIFAVALGIAVTAAVATLALDVGDKVSRELRSFGANLSSRRPRMAFRWPWVASITGLPARERSCRNPRLLV